MAFYVLDENKNLVEAFDKEGFLGLLEQAIEDGDLSGIDEDSAVASKLRSIINGTTHHIEFVTQAQYNQLAQDEELVAGTYYFITDDETAEEFADAIEALQTALNNLNERLTNVEATLSFGNADDFIIYKQVENGEIIVNNIVPFGLYLAIIYDQTQAGTIANARSISSVLFYLYHSNTLVTLSNSSVFRLLVGAQTKLCYIGTSVTNGENTLVLVPVDGGSFSNYTIALRKIGT